MTGEWNLNNKGKMPCDADVMVEVQYRNGDKRVSRAGSEAWTVEGVHATFGHLDIMKWRPHKPKTEKRPRKAGKPVDNPWRRNRGRMPCGRETKVEVRLRNGLNDRDVAKNFRWDIRGIGGLGEEGDIMTWRPVSTVRKQRTPRPQKAQEVKAEKKVIDPMPSLPAYSVTYTEPRFELTEAGEDALAPWRDSLFLFCYGVACGAVGIGLFVFLA